jgi:hypothetical protein
VQTQHSVFYKWNDLLDETVDESGSSGVVSSPWHERGVVARREIAAPHLSQRGRVKPGAI